MEKVLTITIEEAQMILEAFDTLEREFGGCGPLDGRCGQFSDFQSIECRICKRLRALLDQEGKEE